MSTLLIANPAATTAQTWVRDAIIDALRGLGPLDVCMTEHRGHATELARSARARGIEQVATFGGDGTINEVVNGLLAEGPATDSPVLLPIPGGHTNVFARVIGVPQDPLEATGALIDAVQADRTRSIALGRADARYFLCSAGLGLDAEVLRRVERQRAQGARASIPRFVASAVLAHASSLQSAQPQIAIRLSDGHTIPGIFTAIVQNAPVWTYAGSLPITFAPDADFDNGLSVFGIRSLDPIRLGNHLARATLRPAWLGGDSAAGDLGQFRLLADSPTPFQVDGDVVGMCTDVAFSSVPGALRVAVVE